MIQNNGPGSTSYVRSAVASFLRVMMIDVGLYALDAELFVYVRTSRTWRPTLLEWLGFVRVTFPATIREHLFFLPADTDPELGDAIAKRAYAAMTGNGFTNDAERAAFALGGAQAVADLVLAEQRQGEPAQSFLPT